MSIVATRESTAIPYTSPRSTTLIPSSGSTTSRIASSRSSRSAAVPGRGRGGRLRHPGGAADDVLLDLGAVFHAHAFSLAVLPDPVIPDPVLPDPGSPAATPRATASLNAIHPSSAHFTRAG